MPAALFQGKPLDLIKIVWMGFAASMNSWVSRVRGNIRRIFHIYITKFISAHVYKFCHR